MTPSIVVARAPARTRALAAAALLSTAVAAAPARADAPAASPVVKGATLVTRVAPERGFVDTALAFDGAGGRLAYVHTDAGELHDVVVLDLATRAEVRRVPLPAIAATPRSLAFVGDGDRLLVVAQATEDTVRAVVLDPRGKIVRKHGPATAITAVTYDDRPAVALYTRREGRGKAGGLRHLVEVFDLERGKRLGKRRELVSDHDLRVGTLDFRINHWLDGHTVAVGIVGGEYDAVEDQRAPSAEGWYDVPRGVFARRVPITDVIAHARTRALLAGHSNERVFLQASRDRRRLERVVEGVVTPIELTEPFHHYDPASLTYRRVGDTLFASLTIDPVHPDAAAARRAVPVWIDLYELPAGATRARRRARLQPVEGGAVRWQATARHWAVVPRHVGFDRGGPSLDVYALD